MREIEVKIKADDLATLEKILTARGCQLSEELHQHDTVYAFGAERKRWEKPKEGDIVMRIRRQNEIVKFTLKKQCSHEKDNIEHELQIENQETMHEILQTLGYTPVVEVKKIRRTGKLGDYEICLDQVEELGSFVELEKLTTEPCDPVAIEEDLLRILEDLGLSRTNQVRNGYGPQLFLLHS